VPATLPVLLSMALVVSYPKSRHRCGIIETQPARGKIVTVNWSKTEATAIRLRPGDDLKSKLRMLATDVDLEAAIILTAVGSLSDVYLRLANQKERTHFEGKYEIVSLTGTLSKYGVHLHLSVANSKGTTFGGHLVDGSIIYTTAEIVIAKLNSLVFRREHCPLSGFEELAVDSLADDFK
jgi:predicted DNA-binding protein with PD1-like motif